MTAPFRSPASGIFQLRVRVPTDLVGIVGRKEEKVSLRTRDPEEAKRAFLREMGKIEDRWSTLRHGVTTVSQKESVAIAGEFYRGLVTSNEDDPGDRDIALARLLADQVAAGSRNVKVVASGRRDITDRLLDGLKNQNRRAVEAYLEDRGERVDEASLERIVTAVNGAMAQGREQILRFTEGDYSPDPKAGRFPHRQTKQSVEEQSADFYDLVTIYEQYAAESKHARSTRKKWRAIIKGVAAQVPDIRDLTPIWCVKWKDALVARGLAARSIKFGYIAALRSTCAWGVSNRRIESNPVAGITIKVTENDSVSREYTDEEAAFILRLTLMDFPGRFSAETRRARRWVPWLAAYTGARVGEIAQLRKKDVQIKDGVWRLWITPEAGTVKDGNSRFVAVHPDLIAQGFIALVEKSKEGPLFYNPERTRGGKAENPAYKKVGERLAAWIREEGITDPDIAPNHAWRHRFKTLARDHKIDPGTRDYIQGHVPHNEAEKYGTFKPAHLLAEISKIPAFVLAVEEA